MNTTLPTVSVIIPAANAAEHLPRALESVDRQNYPNIIEVIVATSDRESTDAATSHERAIVVDNPSGSTPTALNLAWLASTGDIIARCDVQSVLPPGYISRAVETMRRTGAANVGGRQVPIGETRFQRAIAAAMTSPLGAGDARYRRGGTEGAVETVYLGVFDRRVLEDLNGFDEAFLRTQDYELNHRIVKSGAIVWFDPELAVEYTPRKTLGEIAMQYYEYGVAKRQFGRRHQGSLRWRQLLPPLFVVGLAGSILLSIWWPLALLAPAGYLVVVLTAGVATRVSPLRTATAIVTMHVSWGIGFLSGKWSTK